MHKLISLFLKHFSHRLFLTACFFRCFSTFKVKSFAELAFIKCWGKTQRAGNLERHSSYLLWQYYTNQMYKKERGTPERDTLFRILFTDFFHYKI